MAESTLRWELGEVRISRIEETIDPLDGTILYPAATRAGLEAHRDWLAPNFMSARGDLILSYHALIVEADELVIMVDTCLGEHKVPGWESLWPEHSPFLANLRRAGFGVEDIDVVLCTHMHFDHTGWNTRYVDGRLVPTFPRARYLFSRAEWEYWGPQKDPIVATSTKEVAVRPLVESGQAEFVASDYRLSPSIWLEATPGHSPGHVAVRISSRGEEALLSGDAVHHPVQWAETAWCALADTDLEQSKRTRDRLIDEHADRDTLIIGAHFAPPCAGRVVRTTAGVRFVDR